MDRRQFLDAALAAAAAGLVPAPARALAAQGWAATLPLLPAPKGTTGPVVLSAAPGNYDLGDGPRAGALLINQQWPSPTLRLDQGQLFEATLDNQLDEPTIIHWHGLTPPSAMDGHPVQVIDAGTSRSYQFTIDDPPGTYWYHPHPHHRTGYQVYFGMAGFLLVSDGLDADRGLPTGARDIPLLLADKRVVAGELVFAPTSGEMMAGFLGNEVLVNGTIAPVLAVEPAVLRLRLLNGSNARILNPAMADGRTFWLIGTDAGLLSAPVPVTSVLLSPGERVEVLVDLRADAGGSVDIVSPAFAIVASSPPSAPPQGTAFDLLRLQVSEPLGADPGTVPAAFEPILPPSVAAGPPRVFTFAQSGMQHTINGLVYELSRIDFTVRLGEPETWRFVNDGNQPHPMHMHGTRFRVLSRSGPALASDAGWKDTVLVRVGETVDIALRFDVPGLFLFHCHNLEHEDHGMMLNFVVEDRIFGDGFESPAGA